MTPRTEPVPGTPVGPPVQGGGWVVSDEASITIRTDEGDTVTLSLASTVSALALRAGSGAGESGNVTATLRSIAVDRSASLEVEGDLSPRERRDVMRVIKRALKALRSFFEGHLRSAFRRLASLRLPGSLAAVSVEASRTVTASGVSAPAPEPEPEPVLPAGVDVTA
jgi:hypothetical protein